MNEDPRCCGSGICSIDTEGRSGAVRRRDPPHGHGASQLPHAGAAAFSSFQAQADDRAQGATVAVRRTVRQTVLRTLHLHGREGRRWMASCLLVQQAGADRRINGCVGAADSAKSLT